MRDCEVAAGDEIAGGKEGCQFIRGMSTTLVNGLSCRLFGRSDGDGIAVLSVWVGDSTLAGLHRGSLEAKSVPRAYESLKC